MLDVDAGLLAAVAADPADEAAWLVLADWLEENGLLPQAELMRLSLVLRRPAEVGLRRAEEARLRELLGQGVRAVLPRATFSLAEGVDLTLSLVPPGTFLMGTPGDEHLRDDEDESPLHRVTITKGFWMGVYPVTQAQWVALMGENPSSFEGDDQRPVEEVGWDVCVEFCARLSERTGKRFRLPTEAEWEYACRAGTSSPFSFGPTISSEQANYDGTQRYRVDDPQGPNLRSTSAVGLFPPNAFGLCEMHGNVWEWCSDWYDEGYYARSPERDPPGADTGNERVCRGGAWFNSPGYLRSGNRAADDPDSEDDASGFRVVMEL